VANTLGTNNRPQAAFAVYRDLADRQPQNARFQFLAGTAALTADVLEEADRLLRQALLRTPRDPGILNNLALALNRMGRIGESVHMFRQAVAIRADYVEAWFGLAAALDAQGDSQAALEAYRTVAELRPDDPSNDSNRLMMLNYREEVSVGALFEAHRDLGRRTEAGVAATVPAVAATPQRPPLDGRRLRIGYVSPDFRLHSVSMFLLPLLEALDRKRVELFAYSNVEMPDVVTDQVRRSVNWWRECCNLSDDELAAQIRADAIDVLVDLTGHTARNRLEVVARKPAPVQISWLGYPATTGLAAIDARFTDAIADPPGAGDDHHSERLVRLDGGFLYHRQAMRPCASGASSSAGRSPIASSME